jgi:hypothetical protein
MLRLSTAVFAAALLAGCGASSSAPEAAAPAHADARTKAAVAIATTDAAPAAPEATQPSADGWVHFGGTMSDHEAIAASAVLSAPDAFVGKTVKVTGEVSEVCKSMGCWLTFQHDGQELTVNMADHAFSVDKKGAGSLCEAEGEVVKQGDLVSLKAHAVRMKKQASAPATEAPAEVPADEAAPADTKG